MRKGLVYGLLVVMLSSCLKQVDYPNRPDIEYLGFFPNPNATSKVDSLGYVKFSFTDGDGDLGVDDADTVNYPFRKYDPYHFNLFIRYFERQNGVFVLVEPPDTTLRFNARFRRLTSDGGNGSIQGEMNVGVVGNISPYDTIRYEMYIVDRALNHSDTIATEPLVIDL